MLNGLHEVHDLADPHERGDLLDKPAVVAEEKAEIFVERIQIRRPVEGRVGGRPGVLESEDNRCCVVPDGIVIDGRRLEIDKGLGEARSLGKLFDELVIVAFELMFPTQKIVIIRIRGTEPVLLFGNVFRRRGRCVEGGLFFVGVGAIAGGAGGAVRAKHLW
jgi:hypothetical protein